MSSELKPVAYMHYWIGGYPPDGYVEESELLTPFQAEAYKDLENNEAEGVIPLVIVPEGYQLVPIEPTGAMLDDADMELLNAGSMTDIYKAMLLAAKEGEE